MAMSYHGMLPWLLRKTTKKNYTKIANDAVSVLIAVNTTGNRGLKARSNPIVGLLHNPHWISDHGHGSFSLHLYRVTLANSTRRDPFAEFKEENVVNGRLPFILIMPD